MLVSGPGNVLSWLLVPVVAAASAHAAQYWLGAGETRVESGAPGRAVVQHAAPTTPGESPSHGTVRGPLPTAPNAMERRLDSLQQRVGDMEAEREQLETEHERTRQARQRAREQGRQRRSWLARGRERASEDMRQWRASAAPQTLGRVQDALRRAMAGRDSGDYDRARRAWQEAADAAPDSPVAGNAMMELALDHKRQGRFGDALRAAQFVLENHADEFSLDGQAQGVRALVATAEVCASVGESDCVAEVHAALRDEYGQAVLGSGVAAVDYVQGLR